VFSLLYCRWVVPNSLKFGASDAIVEVVVDEERNILYTRTQGSKLQMFDLGKNGDGAPKKVAEESHLCEQKDFLGGSYVAARASKTNLVSIAPISTVESKWLHVVATTSDGRRIYLSTFTLTGSSFPGFSGTHRGGSERPSVLRVVLTQPAPCMGVSGGHNAFGSIFMGGQTQTEGGSVIKAEAAYYSSGALVLSDASPPTVSRLLVATRDLTSLAASSTSGSLSMSQGATVRSPQPLREVVTVLGVEGRALAIADILPPPDRAAALDFSTWNSSSAAIGKQVASLCLCNIKLLPLQLMVQCFSAPVCFSSLLLIPDED
jgi:nuclear pore complex protein Nup155